MVLPGLDTDLDEESWRLIAGDRRRKIAAAPGHPQFAMQALLTRIGIARSAVESLAKANGREALLSEAMRPAMRTDAWRERANDLVFAAQADAAVSTMTVIEAANAEEEALAIAVALREAVARRQDRRAGDAGPRAWHAVSPPRWRAGISRWKIPAAIRLPKRRPEFSRGLRRRPPSRGLEPVTLLALLKHPLLRLGASDQRHATDLLERAVLRGPRPEPRHRRPCPGAQNAARGQETRLHPSDPRKSLSDGEIGEAERLVAKLATALEPLEEPGSASLPLSELAARHREVLAALSRAQR